MSDFFVAIGLVLVLEGLVYAAFPDLMKRMIFEVLTLPSNSLRSGGLMAMLIGVVIIYLIRG
ncbi:MULTISPECIES: DUF2065 domain-containing protein [Cohaesibacter]|uniref:DUF2065 domain-containing protein n=1 Tax=Cohaesibacter TaxID=655352 RepID=UPI000DEBF667|nr:MULTISPECIES: DUF2065 domain-containing protein [Cohaesibacter]TLP48466.1 DUF2065 domain-containing protein [Cohaesibacter sp. CAU 1516]